MKPRKLGMRANANVSVHGINWWKFTGQGFQVSRGKPLPNIPQRALRRIGLLVVKTEGGGGGGLHCPNYNKLHLITLMVEMIIIIIVTTT